MPQDSDNDDLALFHQKMAGITPLSHDKVHPPSKPKNTDFVQQRRSDSQQDEPLSDLYEPTELVGAEESLSYRRSGIQERQLTKLRQGRFQVEAELDLHGMTIAVAYQALNDFLSECQQYDIRCVRIIHGKGWSSSHHKPILKTKLNQWLRGIDIVLAFCSAKIEDGGNGALYLLLSRREQHDDALN